jgi:tol-pal system beta propeller repeat protein TolB
LIAFTSNRGGNNDIYVIKPDGTGLKQLTFSPYDDRVPCWSPDGNWIAYQSNQDGDFELYVLKLETGNSRKVTSNGCNDYAPAWSPDGDQFVFYSDCDGNREIYTINVDGSSRNQLTRTSAVYNWFPLWSHDGQKITYSSNQSSRNYQIFTMRADGSNPVALAQGCVSSYSPDDRWILFSTYCTDSGDIWIMRDNGNNLQQITTNASNLNPSWSPDGQWIVFQYEVTENDHDIYIMDREGENWLQLTSGSSRDGAPVWQP